MLENWICDHNVEGCLGGGALREGGSVQRHGPFSSKGAARGKKEWREKERGKKGKRKKEKKNSRRRDRIQLFLQD